jgi:hypothetical protein
MAGKYFGSTDGYIATAITRKTVQPLDNMPTGIIM